MSTIKLFNLNCNLLTCMSKETGIWFAADRNLTFMVDIIREIHNYIKGIKIGYPLILNSDVGLTTIINTIRDVCDLPIIADLKIVDIPYIAEKIVFTAFNAGCDGVTIAGICGKSTLTSCKRIAKNKEIYVFTQFTHDDGLIDDNIADKILETVKEVGVTGVQVPATKLYRIRHARKVLGDDYIIVSCGVGFQGPPVGSAIREGANYEIVGRLIYESENVLETVIKMNRKIKEISKIKYFSPL